MDQRYDPNQGMKWYKFLRIFLIFSLVYGLASFVANFNTAGYTYSDFSRIYPEFTFFSTLFLICNSILVVFLIISLFEYSTKAPNICLMNIASSVIFTALILAFSGIEGILASAIGNLIATSLFYFINYMYLRQRLIKKYWPVRNTVTERAPLIENKSPGEHAFAQTPEPIPEVIDTVESTSSEDSNNTPPQADSAGDNMREKRIYGPLDTPERSSKTAPFGLAVFLGVVCLITTIAFSVLCIKLWSIEGNLNKITEENETLRNVVLTYGETDIFHNASKFIDLADQYISMEKYGTSSDKKSRIIAKYMDQKQELMLNATKQLGAIYIGDKSSGLVHFANCVDVQQIKHEDMVFFGSIQGDEGYQPCLRCW